MACEPSFKLKVEAMWMAAWTEFQRVGAETQRPQLETICDTSLKHTSGQNDDQ